MPYATGSSAILTDSLSIVTALLKFLCPSWFGSGCPTGLIQCSCSVSDGGLPYCLTGTDWETMEDVLLLRHTRTDVDMVKALYCEYPSSPIDAQRFMSSIKHLHTCFLNALLFQYSHPLQYSSFPVFHSHYISVLVSNDIFPAAVLSFLADLITYFNELLTLKIILTRLAIYVASSNEPGGL